MNIVVHPDITGAAPADCAWYAIDDETFDGAPDAGKASTIGRGHTPGAAIADLLEQLGDDE